MSNTLDDLTNEVKSAAIEVYETLGVGYEERIYEEAMAVEFRRRKIPYEIERDAEVFSIKERKLVSIGLISS